jgi:crossover junction endodeoxyribonuclease RuvC
MIIFGIDPGSERTGYGCVESDGSRHRIVTCGAISSPPAAAFPDKLLAIHQGLAALILEHRPDCVAVVGYGRAEKPQVQHMIKLILGLPAVPSPHDAADALAVAICHLHSHAADGRTRISVQPAGSRETSWRAYRPART